MIAPLGIYYFEPISIATLREEMLQMTETQNLCQGPLLQTKHRRLAIGPRRTTSSLADTNQAAEQALDSCMTDA